MTGPASTDDPAFWDLVSDALIPASAIVVSVLIAVLLFMAERRSSEAARQLERQDKLLEEIIASLAFFVSVNPISESWRSEWRRLRAQITILQTLPMKRTRLLGDWMVLEGQLGMQLTTTAIVTLNQYPSAPEDIPPDVIISTMQPSHDWAAYCINSIASWMRGDVKDEAIRDRITELSPPVGDGLT